jgi:Glycosyltransferase family 87
VFWTTVRLSEAGGGSGGICAAALILSPIAVGALYRTHFDTWPTAMTMAALLVLARNRPRLGLGLLGLGTATKLFPALLVPMTLVWLVARGERRAAWQGAAVFAVVVALIALPFATHGLGRVVTFHLDRPVQIESTPATVLLAVGDSTVTGVPGHPNAFKSQGLVGGPADAVAAVCAALSLAAIVAVAFAARRRTDARWLVLCAFATLVAFVALGKVLSPQFLIWLVPFAALAWAWREWTAAAAVTAAIIFTQLEFPSRYWDLVYGSTGPAVLVGARNALLLVALTSLLARVVAPARWRRPAAAVTR